MEQKRNLKIAVIGSGSSYLPDIAQMIIEDRDSMPVDEWALMDIDEYRLKCTGTYCAKMIKDAGLETKVTMTTDLESACKDANFVITTIRVGLSDTRITDESIPNKYNFVGQETTAPGGFMMGLRNIPEMVKIARTMERVSAKGAWLINLANPSGMMTEALNMFSNIHCVGLCNGPTVFNRLMRQYFADEIEKDDDIFCVMSGLNHILYGKVYVKGVDRTEDGKYRLEHGWGEAQPFRLESMGEGIQKFVAGWIPFGPYARYYYQFQDVINDQNKGIDKMVQHSAHFAREMNKRFGEDLINVAAVEAIHSRAEWVKIIESVTLDLMSKGDERGFILAQNSRGGRDYGRAGMDMIECLWTGKRRILNPDYQSMGTVPGFDGKYVATTTSIVDASGVHPIVCDPLPPHIMATIQAAKQYELMAAKAAMSGSYKDCMEALMSSSLINDWDQARKCLDEMLLAQKEYLPNFARVIQQLEQGIDPLLEELKE